MGTNFSDNWYRSNVLRISVEKHSDIGIDKSHFLLLILKISFSKTTFTLKFCMAVKIASSLF